ncbi:MAG: alkaline phosphatase [Coraliomargarita sp.]
MSDLSSSSRRSFLKGAGLVGAASLLSANHAAALSPKQLKQAGSAKNLIFLVADGMGTGTLSLANHWKLRNKKTPLNWMQLYERQGLILSMQDTASASSPVTDSAAAASSWGSGQRVNNGSINVSVDGTLLTPIWTYAKQAGKRTGLVTTCRVTHATPAGFSANVANRGMEDTISQQYLEREIDVILGGGKMHFERGPAPAPVAGAVRGPVLPELHLFPKFQAKEYQIVEDRARLAAASGHGRLLGLFSEDHIPYAIDRSYDPKLREVPSLAEMFAAALNNLSGSKEGFVLQVEGGRIDHAGHVNDPATILHEMLDFDVCIPLAMKFMEENPDTLVIVTTDHGTGGCQLNGEGAAYADSGPAMDRINSFRGSLESLEKQCLQTGKFNKFAFQRTTGIQVTKDQAESIQDAISSKVPYLAGVMADVVQDQLGLKTAVGWTSHNHTAEHVPLLAFGPGSDAIPPLIPNNHLFTYMTQALGFQVV